MEYLEKSCLRRLTFGDARIPRIWKIVAEYERLVVSGFAKEVEQDNTFIRQFTITDDGLKEAK